ncbi:MAG: polyribonucleotide nucleotidyltransferase, partial [Oscillospiraceae bacterium]|nr:polyribonucleotide nucleotidyltransferase [Oscillospiraceae bacterium]
NPTSAQREKSKMHVTVASVGDKVAMIEAGADEIPEDVMLEGIMFAHNENKKIIEFIQGIVNEIGKEKFQYVEEPHDDVLYAKIAEYATEKMQYCMDTDDKTVRDPRLAELADDVKAHFAEEYPDSDALIDACLYKLEKSVVRNWLLAGKRVDGRALDEVRPLAAEVGVLPRVHGSGLFTRGQTQVLTSVTLGTVGDIQTLDTIYEEDSKRYIHHYNFPPYSVGEARGIRSPGRREIGHGALAERALLPVIPTEEEFPYCIRLVSEVLSSNGSTSQGSVCGSTLALMDAGVPIKRPVAGISCGLITEGDRWLTFTDIQGVEDFFGDMDFKVAGTTEGITAIQMDLKIDGLTRDIIKSAFERTRLARLEILDQIMLKAIPAPRAELSPYAPKMLHTMIDTDKIREVIGKGGSVIQKITADTGTKIDIEDDGSVFISATDINACRRALKIIEGIVKDPKVGDVFYGKVTRILTFGAFVEIAPGKEGMIHISKLENHRVGKVEDVLNIGDETWCKVIEIDEKGRINLSRKDVTEEDKQSL